MELLSPAGNRSSLQSAIENGADAVYFGAGGFNARQSADNFPDVASAVHTCHQKGVKAYLTLNTLVRDRELNDWLQTACIAANAGIDAFIVQDLGGAMLLHKHFPNVPLHASTQMTIRNVEAAKTLVKLGFCRIVLAREMTKEEIAELHHKVNVELEVFVHGALCVCYSGQCLMSSILGGRSANRGRCAQPCRLQYLLNGKKGYHLSTKDLCLLEHMEDLRSAGVTSLKIEGRMKRPEYVGAVTAIYQKALSRKAITDDDIRLLKILFNRGGFTAGRFAGDKRMLYKKSPAHIGLSIGKALHTQANKAVFKTDVRLFPKDELVHTDAKALPVTVKSVAALKNGQQEVTASASFVLGAEYRLIASKKRTEQYIARPVAQTEPSAGPPENIVCPSVVTPKNTRRRNRILAAKVSTPQQAAAIYRNVSVLYLPIHASFMEIAKTAQSFGTTVIGAYPQMLDDSELASIRSIPTFYSGVMLGTLLETDAEVKIADHSLNCMNSQTLAILATLGYCRATLSPELNGRQMQDIFVPSGMETEAIVYGRLPLMVTEHCPVGPCADGQCTLHRKQPVYLEDRKGMRFPLVKTGDGCRATLLNSLPIFMADRINDVEADVLRMDFTLEKPEECVYISKQYKNALAGSAVSPPAKFTRGHFKRGVE
ncbi:MAG: U32 family peptidase [Christensenellaceae bacterium]|jgi:putative protease